MFGTGLEPWKGGGWYLPLLSEEFCSIAGVEVVAQG
jgi:hypothetical protein